MLTSSNLESNDSLVNECNYDPDNEDNTLGVRVPLGIKYHFPYSIVDIWGEVDPGIELINDTNAILHGGIGLTFWLK